MLIRDLQKSDLPSVRSLLGELGYQVDSANLAQRVLSVQSAPGHCVAVAVLDDAMVGLVHVYERPALEKPCEAVVQALVVEEGHRGEGVGGALMRTAETWARERGVETIMLHTRIDRSEAQACYAGLGYHTTATSHLMRKKFGR